MGDLKNIVLIGASGHAKVIIDIVKSEGKCRIVGLIDSFRKKGETILGYQILGNEYHLNRLMETYEFEACIIAIGDNWTRRILHDRIRKLVPSLNFYSTIHPSAVLSNNVQIGIGSVIMPGAVINSGSQIGDFCIINTNASVDHDCIIDDFSSIAPGAVLGGQVQIGKSTVISVGANIIQNISIGDNTIIGAGALVLKDVGDLKMAYGVPAKLVRSIKKGTNYLHNYGTKLVFESENDEDIRIQEIRDKIEWDNFLSRVDNYDTYHTYEYHTIAKYRNDEAILLSFQKDNILIGLPLLIRKIPLTKYKDATSVYGYPGPVSSGISNSFDNRQFVAALKNYFLENNIVSVFSRLNPFIPYQSVIIGELGKIQNHGKVVNINLNLENSAQLKHYNRRLKTYVNKARKHCIVREAQNENDLDEFISIYYENMKRVKAEDQYYFEPSYFHDLFHSVDFKTDLLLVMEKETGNIIAGSMFFKCNGIIQYHLSGSRGKYIHLYPTKLLVDEMRVKANEEGFKFFNLGGGLYSGEKDGLLQFKSSFSKDFHEFKLWKIITNDNIYEQLTNENNHAKNTNFFPAYRSIL